MVDKKSIKIVEILLENARNKLCSRYVLALERVQQSLVDGSAEKALREQKDWIDTLERGRLKRRKKK